MCYEKLGEMRQGWSSDIVVSEVGMAMSNFTRACAWRHRCGIEVIWLYLVLRLYGYTWYCGKNGYNWYRGYMVILGIVVGIEVIWSYFVSQLRAWNIVVYEAGVGMEYCAL